MASVGSIKRQRVDEILDLTVDDDDDEVQCKVEQLQAMFPWAKRRHIKSMLSATGSSIQMAAQLLLEGVAESAPAERIPSPAGHDGASGPTMKGFRTDPPAFGAALDCDKPLALSDFSGRLSTGWVWAFKSCGSSSPAHNIEELVTFLLSADCGLKTTKEKEDLLSALAERSQNKTGKWQAYVPEDSRADALWQDVARAVRGGILGSCAKVSPQPCYAFIVYVDDYSDVRDAKRVLTHLVKIAAKHNIKINSGFKPDFLTLLGKYSNKKRTQDGVQHMLQDRGIRLSPEQQDILIDRIHRLPCVMYSGIKNDINACHEAGTLKCPDESCLLCTLEPEK